MLSRHSRSRWQMRHAAAIGDHHGRTPRQRRSGFGTADACRPPVSRVGQRAKRAQTVLLVGDERTPHADVTSSTIRRPRPPTLADVVADRLGVPGPLSVTSSWSPPFHGPTRTCTPECACTMALVTSSLATSTTSSSTCVETSSATTSLNHCLAAAADDVVSGNVTSAVRRIESTTVTTHMQGAPRVKLRPPSVGGVGHPGAWR